MASNNIARMGVVLGLDTAEFTAAIDKAIGENRKLGAAIKKDMNAAAAEIVQLKYATEDYGKTLTKVQLIEREIAAGRYQNATSDMKDALLKQAAAYDAVAASAKKATTGMTEWQKQGLMYQTTDFVTQVASGQNVLIAALQQGGQLKDQMGGLVPMFTMLSDVILTTTGAAVALAAVLGTIGYGAYSGRKEFDGLQKSIALTGNYAQVSTGEYYKMAEALANTTKVTIGGAKDIMSAMLSSGQFTKDTFNSVGQVIAKYSELTGLTATDAATKLIPALDGTASGAKRLNDQYNFLTLEQYKQIELLEKQGKKQEAVRLEADLLNTSFNKSTIELGYLDTALDKSAKMFSAFWAAVKDVGKPDDIPQQIRNIQEQINAVVAKGAPKARPLLGDKDENVKAYYDELARLEGLKAKLIASIVATQKDAEKMGGQKEKITSYAQDLGLDKARAISKQIADIERESKYEALLRGVDDATRIELEAKKAREKINDDYLVDVRDKDDRYQLLRKQQKDAAIKLENEKEATAIAALEKKRFEFQAAALQRKIEMADEARKAEYDASDAAMRKEAAEKEHLRLDWQKTVEDIDAATFQRELDRQKQEIKETEDAIKFFEALGNKKHQEYLERRDKELAADIKLREKQKEYYDKAKETNDLEKDKVAMQIKLIGASDKRVKLAQVELDYEKDLKDIREKSWMTEQEVLEAQQRALEKRQSSEELVRMQGHLKDLQETNDVVWKDMSSAIDEMVDKGETSFSKLAQSIINDMTKIWLKRQMLDLMDSAKGGMSGMGGMGSIGGLLGGIGQLFGFGASGGTSKGAYMPSGSFDIPGKAAGGPIDGLTLVGEKGPELFMPNGAGTIIPNDKLGDMGSGQTINYNGPYIAQMSAIDTQSGLQFLAKNKQGVWASYQSANRSIPMSR